MLFAFSYAPERTIEAHLRQFKGKFKFNVKQMGTARNHAHFGQREGTDPTSSSWTVRGTVVGSWPAIILACLFVVLSRSRAKKLSSCSDPVDIESPASSAGSPNRCRADGARCPVPSFPPAQQQSWAQNSRCSTSSSRRSTGPKYAATSSGSGGRRREPRPSAG